MAFIYLLKTQYLWKAAILQKTCVLIFAGQEYDLSCK